MSKQKYYVKLKEEFQATGVTFADMRLYLDENGALDLKYFAHPFTKSELTKIKDGAFYKRAPYGEIEETGVRTGWYHVMDDDSFDDEWINPLIELVPVGTKIYTAEQMQEYAKAQSKKVFWYAAKGTSEDRAILARAIDYVFKEAQDES